MFCVSCRLENILFYAWSSHPYVISYVLFQMVPGDEYDDDDPELL